MASPKFNPEFDPQYGEAVSVAPGIERVTANNSGPFTFRGTNTYILGEKNVAVIDPGPTDPKHFEVLKSALNGRKVSHIIVSHTHMDHSPLARPLQAAFGGDIYCEGPHRAARDLHIGEINPLDASADHDFKPDVTMADSEVIEGDGWALDCIHTPGHTANHMAFALRGTSTLFSADHVMAWATSIVAPPDGSMSEYMASLDKLLQRPEQHYLPGHGGSVVDAHAFVRGLKGHRKMREKAVLNRIEKGDVSIPEMVKVIYRDTDPRLHGAAALSVLAHIEDLVERQLVLCDGAIRIDGRYTPTEKR